MIQQLSVLAILVICGYEDLKSRRIGTIWLFVFAVEGVFLWFMEGTHSMFEIVPAVSTGLFVLLLAFITKGGIGEGDGLLLMIIGIFLGGADTFRIFLYALLLSGGYAVFLSVIRKKNRKYEIAFIPFLLLAFAGESLFHNLKGCV